MHKYLVRVKGCHDETRVLVELNEDGYDLVKGIAEAITKKSESECMPTMEIIPWD